MYEKMFRSLLRPSTDVKQQDECCFADCQL